MGCAQMELLSEFIETKRRIGQNYSLRLNDAPGIIPMREAPWARSGFWLNTVLVNEAAYGMSSRDLMHRLKDWGIETRPLWQPIHLSPAYQAVQAPACEVAKALWRDALSLPSSVGLNEEAESRVVESLFAFSSVRPPDHST